LDDLNAQDTQMIIQRNKMRRKIIRMRKAKASNNRILDASYELRDIDDDILLNKEECDELQMEIAKLKNTLQKSKQRDHEVISLLDDDIVVDVDNAKAAAALKDRKRPPTSDSKKVSKKRYVEPKEEESVCFTSDS
jgi:hypothetical protein